MRVVLFSPQRQPPNICSSEIVGVTKLVMRIGLLSFAPSHNLKTVQIPEYQISFNGITCNSAPIDELIITLSLSLGLCLRSLSVGHAFRKNTAGAFGPDLAKKLSQLVKMEKNVMRSMELVGRERMEVAVSNKRCTCDRRTANNVISNNCQSGGKLATTTFLM